MAQNSRPSRMARKKEETKQKIVKAAMRLFFQQGLDNTTMEQIAEEVDIAKGTLYNYFPVKEAILDEFMKRSFQESDAERAERMRALPDTHSRMTWIFTELIAGIQRQREIFEKYVAYRMKSWISFRLDESEKSGFQWIAANIIKLGQQSGEIRGDLPQEILEDLCEYSFMLAVKEFYLDPEHFNGPETIQRCVDLFLNGSKQKT